jgi:hypothetical protein
MNRKGRREIYAAYYYWWAIAFLRLPGLGVDAHLITGAP